jgi:DNA-binding winged helix-turn-helix (wHTH) protein
MRKDGVVIKLQMRPLKVLALLASRAGELVTREEIQQHVWLRSRLSGFRARTQLLHPAGPLGAKR